MASMSSAFRHVCHGMAGLTGAPRPALVMAAAGGVSGREQDINTTTSSAANATRLFKGLVCGMGVIILR